MIHGRLFYRVPYRYPTSSSGSVPFQANAQHWHIIQSDYVAKEQAKTKTQERHINERRLAPLIVARRIRFY